MNFQLNQLKCYCIFWKDYITEILIKTSCKQEFTSNKSGRNVDF